MKEIKDTYFDETLDGFIPVVPGVYPAHVVGVETRDFESGNTVFNVTFQMADECKNITVPRLTSDGNGGYTDVLDDKGNPTKIDAGYLSGKKFRSQGVWLTPRPNKGEGWRNRNYKEFFAGLGIVFEENDGKVKLGFVEEDDVLGMPTLVKLGEETYEKDGESRKAIRIFSCYPWNDGIKLKADEIGNDVPF